MLAIVEYGLMRLPQEASASHLAALVQLLRPLQLLPFMLIAAIALRHHQATLVTRNVREFSRVPGLQWLNWHQMAENPEP